MIIWYIWTVLKIKESPSGGGICHYELQHFTLYSLRESVFCDYVCNEYLIKMNTWPLKYMIQFDNHIFLLIIHRPTSMGDQSTLPLEGFN